MYYAAIQQFIKTLKNLNTILDKANHHAEVRKFDPNNYLALRLAPDMFPLTRQVQMMCDVAKSAAASLVGKEPPKHEDREQTMAEVRERIGKVLSYLESFRAEDFKGVTDQTKVKLTYPQGKAMRAEDFIFSRALPNFFFHATTAYALLRGAGVEIGKSDYLGNLNLFDQ